MSQCFRTISSKLPPFVGSRKQVTQLDRQLPKHIKSSTFLEEFLGTRTVLNPIVTLRDASNKNIPFYLSFKNQSSEDVHKKYPISLRQNEEKKVEITKFYALEELQRFHIPLSYVKPVDSLNESNWLNKRQKNLYKKQKSSFTIKDHVHQMITPVIEDTTMLLTNGSLNLKEQNETKDSPGVNGRVTQEQLQFIHDQLKSDLPLLFVKSLDYRVYRQDIIFVNNIQGFTTKGMFQYVKQVAFLRTIAHLKFAYVKFEILKITMHPEDDTVKIRWRIRGLPGMKVFVTFWKFKFWKIAEAIKESETWYDGFSTFYVSNDGKIFKHVADKMMPDQDSILPKDKPEIVTKLAMFLGIENLKQIFPDTTTAFSNMNNFFLQSKERGKFLEKAMLKIK